jgi:hypothetical protein
LEPIVQPLYDGGYGDYAQLPSNQQFFTNPSGKEDFFKMQFGGYVYPKDNYFKPWQQPYKPKPKEGFPFNPTPPKTPQPCGKCVEREGWYAAMRADIAEMRKQKERNEGRKWEKEMQFMEIRNDKFRCTERRWPLRAHKWDAIAADTQTTDISRQTVYGLDLQCSCCGLTDRVHATSLGEIMASKIVLSEAVRRVLRIGTVVGSPPVPLARNEEYAWLTFAKSVSCAPWRGVKKLFGFDLVKKLALGAALVGATAAVLGTPMVLFQHAQDAICATHKAYGLVGEVTAIDGPKITLRFAGGPTFSVILPRDEAIPAIASTGYICPDGHFHNGAPSDLVSDGEDF